MKNGVIGKSDYNKKNDLPRNIIKTIQNDKHVGYRVNIIRNGEKTTKNFQSQTIPLKKLLEKAIKFKNDFLNKVKIDE